VKGVRRKGRTLVRTLKGGWCRALGLECTATSYKVAIALTLLDVVVKWNATSGDALKKL